MALRCGLKCFPIEAKSPALAIHKIPMRSRYPLIPILFLFLTLAAAETPSPVVELPLLGEAEEAFPGLGWVREGDGRIQAAAVSAAVDEGMSVLVFAPDGGKAGELRLLGGDVAAVTNRCGALRQWEGISLWLRGGGRPSDLVVQWGTRPTHEVRVRNDFKHWKKIHVPWSHFRPSIDPENPPSGPLRVGLERLSAPPAFTLVCADPYGTNLTARTWREARPGEAVGVGQWQGIQLTADQLRWPDSEGLSMWVKMEGRPVYAQAAWLGALDQGKPFQVDSNFWQEVRVDWSELPPPPRLPPVLRISVEAYRYQGDWAMVDRLRLYRGVADEGIEPSER